MLSVNSQARTENGRSGWVYIVTNKALPGLVKVGYTTRIDINQRLREFNQAGLPYPYEKAYALWVEEPRLIEQRVHQALPAHRDYPGWFRCSVERARETIKKIAGPEAETETDRRIAEARAEQAAAEAEQERLRERERKFIEIDLRGRALPRTSKRNSEMTIPWEFLVPVLIFLAAIVFGNGC